MTFSADGTMLAIGEIGVSVYDALTGEKNMSSPAA